MITGSKNRLLKICRVGQIDQFFYKKGFTRSWIFYRVIHKNFFISNQTYYSYLSLYPKAKQILKDKHKIEVDKNPLPVEVYRFLDEATGEILSQYIREGCKH